MKTLTSSKYGERPSISVECSTNTDVFTLYKNIVIPEILAGNDVQAWLTNHFNIGQRAREFVNRYFTPNQTRGRVTKTCVSIFDVADQLGVHPALAALLYHIFVKAGLASWHPDNILKYYILDPNARNNRNADQAQEQNDDDRRVSYFEHAVLTFDQVGCACTFVDFYERVFCPALLKAEKDAFDVVTAGQVAYFIVTPSLTSVVNIIDTFERLLRLRSVNGFEGTFFNHQIFTTAVDRLLSHEYCGNANADNKQQYALLDSEIQTIRQYTNVWFERTYEQYSASLNAVPLPGALRKLASCLQLLDKMHLFETYDTASYIGDYVPTKCSYVGSQGFITCYTTKLRTTKQYVIDLQPVPNGQMILVNNQATEAVFGLIEKERGYMMDLIDELLSIREKENFLFPVEQSTVLAEVTAASAIIPRSVKLGYCADVGNVYVPVGGNDYVEDLPYSANLTNMLLAFGANTTSGSAIFTDIDEATTFSFGLHGGSTPSADTCFACGDVSSQDTRFSFPIINSLIADANCYRVVDVTTFRIQTAVPGLPQPIVIELPHIFQPAGFYGSSVNVINDVRLQQWYNQALACLQGTYRAAESWISGDVVFTRFVVDFYKRSKKYYGDLIRNQIQNVIGGTSPYADSMARQQLARAIVFGSADTFAAYIGLIDPALSAILARVRILADAAAGRLHSDLIEAAI